MFLEEKCAAVGFQLPRMSSMRFSCSWKGEWLRVKLPFSRLSPCGPNQLVPPPMMDGTDPSSRLSPRGAQRQAAEGTVSEGKNGSSDQPWGRCVYLKSGQNWRPLLHTVIKMKKQNKTKHPAKPDLVLDF